MNATNLPSVGVQSLIERLREEGVEKGRLESQQLLGTARAEAEGILEAARVEAARVRGEAAESARREREAMSAAFELARRDALLRLREDIERQLVRRLRELAAAAAADPATLAALVLQLLRNVVAAPPAQQAPVVMVRDLPDETIDQLVQQLVRELGNDGIRIERGHGGPRGLRLRLDPAGGEHELDEVALAQLLAERILPRFRAMMEGLRPGAA